MFRHVMQYQGFNFSECGPTALAMLATQGVLHKRFDRYQCRAQKRTPSWWYASDVVEAGAKLGLPLQLAHISIKSQAGIYLSSYWGFGHWVVAWKLSDNLVQVLDPKRGPYTTTEARFRRSLKSTVYVSSSVIFKKE